MNWKKLLSWRSLLVVAVGGVLLIELGLRYLIDFPLYGADKEVGYFVRPNQHGAYLGKNDWVFNRQGMGVAEDFSPSSKLDVLLVGDSIVYGGNPLPQREKLGPKLEAETGWQVWPVSAGSWGLQNELTYLKRIPDATRGSNVIVFVFNSGDFAEPSSWASEYTHPRSHPASYLLYLAGKFRGAPAQSPADLVVKPWSDLPGEWSEFVEEARKPVVVVAYPAEAERFNDCKWVPDWVKAVGNFACFGKDRALEAGDYRDDIHPSASGTKKLVSFIRERVDALPSARP